MKVLVVEDESAIRKLIQMMLAGQHEVHVVENVDQALEKIANEAWDLVLTDYKMPGRSGIDLIHHLHAEALKIPVILMTGQGSQDAEVELIKESVTKVLSKPFSRDVLIASIGAIVPPAAS